MCNTFRFFTFLGANENLDRLFGRYIESIDGVIFCDGKALSVRKDLNGVLLVDTALQRKLQKPEEKVFLELLLPEVLYSSFFLFVHRLNLALKLFQANSFYIALSSAELVGVDCVDEVLKELEKEIEACRKQPRKSHKQSKVCSISRISKFQPF